MSQDRRHSDTHCLAISWPFRSYSSWHRLVIGCTLQSVGSLFGLQTGRLNGARSALSQSREPTQSARRTDCAHVRKFFPVGTG